MSLIQAIILGIIQGLTEFIPVSSSGHLLLAHYFLGVEGTGLAFDVALHIGTFIALVIYFHNDIKQLILGILGKNEYKKMAWILVLATIPAVIAGTLVQDLAESSFRSPWLVSINMIWVAFAMLLAERYAKNKKSKSDLKEVKPRQGLIIGFAQALALIPGISRSGSTITAGIFTGLDRVAATRFSFLLAIPITFGAIVKVVSDGQVTNSISQEFGIFAAGITASFISGVIAIKFLLKYLSKHSLAVFAYYRIGLGILVLLVLAS